MEFCGIIQSYTYNSITFATEDNLSIDCADLIDRRLSIRVDRYRAKRSLDANGYAWLLMTKIAEIMRTSKDEIYEVMLRDYGTDFTDEDGNIVFIHNIHDKTMNLIGIHCAYVESYFSNGIEMDKYRLIMGSSQYDTLEMSRFIDGIVSDAKELGIQTITPDELRMMKERWHV